MIMTTQYGAKAKVHTFSPSLAELTGSIVSSAMLQFIIQNWERGNHPVSWFAKPCTHRKYGTGRSWKENLGLSLEDIKYGLSFIGTRVNQHTSREQVLGDHIPRFELNGRLTNAKHLVVWYLKNGETFYELNPVLVLISRWLSRHEADITVRLADFWFVSLPRDTTVVYAFGESRDIARMAKKVAQEATRLNKPLVFISYGFMVPGQQPHKQLGAYHLYQYAPLHIEKA